MIKRVLLVLVNASALASPLAGQSLFNAAGLGVPMEALDGRARALGNLGIGLRGGSFMPTDPGALGRLRISTGVMAAAPSWVDYSAGGESGRVQGTRFPLLGVAYPLAGGMMSVQIGSYLDQRYQSSSETSVDFGSGPVTASDVFDQSGSISNLNLGYARMVRPGISAGITAGRFAGSLVRTFTRSYGTEGGATDVDSYVERGEWSYRGFAVTAGVAADVGSDARVSASVQLPTALDANADEGTRGSDRSFDVPIQYRAGASMTLGPALVVNGSVQLADWSGVQDDLDAGVHAGDTNGFGLGVELTQARLLGKDAPLRFGFRRTGLPFAFEEGATERTFSTGLGLELSRSGDVVLASVDVGLERGLRSSATLTENFWRLTISLLASGL